MVNEDIAIEGGSIGERESIPAGQQVHDLSVYGAFRFFQMVDIDFLKEKIVQLQVVSVTSSVSFNECGECERSRH